MSDYNTQVQDGYDRGSYARSSAVTTFSDVMLGVYTWMTAALCISAAVAWLTVSTPAVTQFIFGSSWPIVAITIAELGMVIVLSGRIHQLSPTTATTLFLIYAMLNGVTLSVIFFAYDLGLIYRAFAASALTFGGMSFFGYTTKRDLTGLGGILYMALIGLVIASLINLFWSASVLDSIITYAGVFIFVGLTAYDTQKIKAMAASVELSNDAALPRRFAILGALELYLDFVNLFLYILRLFGRRK